MHNMDDYQNIAEWKKVYTKICQVYDSIWWSPKTRKLICDGKNQNSDCFWVRLWVGIN